MVSNFLGVDKNGALTLSNRLAASRPTWFVKSHFCISLALPKSFGIFRFGP